MAERDLRCPFCSATVLADDATLTLSHAVPLCEDWIRRVAKTADSHSITIADSDNYDAAKMRAEQVASCTPVDPGSLTFSRVAAGWIVSFVCGCVFHGVPNYLEPGTLANHECQKARN